MYILITFNFDICWQGAQSIANFPLDTYSTACQTKLIITFGLWGDAQLSMALMSLIVLIKYKQFISLILAIYCVEYSLKLYLFFMKNGVPDPNQTKKAPGNITNYYWNKFLYYNQVTNN